MSAYATRLFAYCLHATIRHDIHAFARRQRHMPLRDICAPPLVYYLAMLLDAFAAGCYATLHMLPLRCRWRHADFSCAPPLRHMFFDAFTP